MTPKLFDKTVREFFRPVLQEHGFTTDRSQHCTFHRKASDQIYHFIVPDLGSRGAWYDIKVFPSSPLIDPFFVERFPDDMGIPSDSWSYLSERGVGMDQGQFNCKSEENFVQRFEKTVRELLINSAIPYLNQFQTIENLIPVIRRPGFMGLALHHVGRVAEAIPMLEQERDRLVAMGSSDRLVTANIERINELLHLK